jgi:myo-inositol-1(or 4)-monophosphatase
VLSNREILDFAVEAAWRAGRAALGHFQTGLAVEDKADGSPVTVADRQAEQVLRGIIQDRFPAHAVLGEELGDAGSDSRYRWIIDPIDGTRSFARGVPLWGTLLGLEVAGDMVAGVAFFPALDEMLAAARGEGCRWNGRPARVSAQAELGRALVSFTDAAELVEAGVWPSIRARTALQRGFSDCYGYALVATGRAEVMLDARMNPWDCAALLPILEEAGGTATDWTGQARIDGGNLVATNGALLGPMLALLAGRDLPPVP